jgi:hypothetical protein
MDYEWNRAKEKANAEKHGVAFADAALALEDEFAVTVADPDAMDEERFVSLGMDPNGRVLVKVFTHRGDVIRLISSRRAAKAERRQYEVGR